tara:strand:- start:134 stop:610 length:477 start_codon:yes stop_codon:yes gene_type:complete
MINNIDKKQNMQIIENNSSYWIREPEVLLVCSSISFTFPIIIIMVRDSLYVLNNRLFGCLSLIISIVSTISWLDPKNVNKRKIDKIVARTGAFLYIIRGIAVIRGIAILFGVLIWLFMTFSFYQSLARFSRGDKMWLASHAMFHICVTTGTCLIVAHS